ncbi:hypothetical protein [Paenibacillus sp. 1001270B_150601_E10]|uniref:hypothetical protein n=1 Tax=Paenibacillus sp. 1001270B_150601_E10 TaxID=2787079 RepID=UPI00189E717F|nr:hypothetical protein [Paenibacillus sp. 1001270B_150601_E10]
MKKPAQMLATSFIAAIMLLSFPDGHADAYSNHEAPIESQLSIEGTRLEKDIESASQPGAFYTPSAPLAFSASAPPKWSKRLNPICVPELWATVQQIRADGQAYWTLESCVDPNELPVWNAQPPKGTIIPYPWKLVEVKDAGGKQQWTLGLDKELAEQILEHYDHAFIKKYIPKLSDSELAALVSQIYYLELCTA